LKHDKQRNEFDRGISHLFSTRRTHEEEAGIEKRINSLRQRASSIRVLQSTEKTEEKRCHAFEVLGTTAFALQTSST
jgi:hypothetical protein